MVIGFLKRLFAKQKEEVVVSEETVSLSQLEKWFAEKEAACEKSVLDALMQQKPRFDDAVNRFTQACNALREAALPKGVEERREGVFDMARSTYLQAAERFLKLIDFPKTTKEISSFLPHFERSMKEFVKSGFRWFAVLREFLPKQTKALTEAIRAIETEAREVATAYKSSKISEFPLVRERVARIVRQHKRLEAIQKELSIADQKEQQLQHQLRL